MAERGSSGPARIGYVVMRYPSLSETFVWDAANELVRQGIDLQVFALLPGTGGKVHALCKELEARVHRLPWRPGPLAVGFLRSLASVVRRAPGRALRALTQAPRADGLRAFLRAFVVADLSGKLGVDYLHAHYSYITADVARIAAIINDLPFGFTAAARDLALHGEGLARKAESALWIVAISEADRRTIRQRVGSLDVSKVALLRNGIDVAAFGGGAREPARAQDGLVTGLAVGRLVPKKGFAVLLEALRLLRDRGETQFAFTLCGHGPERPSLEAQIRKWSLGDVVRLAGPVTRADLLGLYADGVDLFILPCVTGDDGDVDGIPNALKEAMAAGVPVITTGVGAISELVHHGENGLLAEAGSALSLAEAMVALAADRSRARRLGRAGRETVRAEYDLRRQVALWCDELGVRYSLYRSSAGSE